MKYLFWSTLLLLSITGLFVHALPAHAGGAIFGSREMRSGNLKPFPKWTGVLDRYFDQGKIRDRECSPKNINRCTLKQWKGFLAGLQNKPLMMQIKEVNRHMNRKRYIIDPINWGVTDYWATPYQFFSKDGDCEDYAIAKFMSLRALGVPNEDMRIVILNDTNLNILHAVLAVYVDGKPYILDNQIKQVIAADKVYHYRPIYSINESHWWRHR